MLYIKPSLPGAIECCCIKTAHNWSTIDLDHALKKLVPTKRKTTKQDMLDTLNTWLQIRKDLGAVGNDVKLTVMHAFSLERFTDHSDLPRWRGS